MWAHGVLGVIGGILARATMRLEKASVICFAPHTDADLHPILWWLLDLALEEVPMVTSMPQGVARFLSPYP